MHASSIVVVGRNERQRVLKSTESIEVAEFEEQMKVASKKQMYRVFAMHTSYNSQFHSKNTRTKIAYERVNMSNPKLIPSYFPHRKPEYCTKDSSHHN